MVNFQYRRDAEEFHKNQARATGLSSDFYIGHYTPLGNCFQAFAIKDKLIEFLEPKPIAYATWIAITKSAIQESDEQIFKKCLEIGSGFPGVELPIFRTQKFARPASCETGGAYCVDPLL